MLAWGESDWKIHPNIISPLVTPWTGLSSGGGVVEVIVRTAPYWLDYWVENLVSLGSSLFRGFFRFWLGWGFVNGK